MNLPVPYDDTFSVALSVGLFIGLAIGSVLSWLMMRAYKRALQFVARNGGYEKINGKWYRITETCDTLPEISDDMGIPMRVHER